MRINMMYDVNIRTIWAADMPRPLYNRLMAEKLENLPDGTLRPIGTTQYLFVGFRHPRYGCYFPVPGNAPGRKIIAEPENGLYLFRLNHGQTLRLVFPRHQPVDVINSGGTLQASILWLVDWADNLRVRLDDDIESGTWKMADIHRYLDSVKHAPPAKSLPSMWTAGSGRKEIAM